MALRTSTNKEQLLKKGVLAVIVVTLGMLVVGMNLLLAVIFLMPVLMKDFDFEQKQRAIDAIICQNEQVFDVELVDSLSSESRLDYNVYYEQNAFMRNPEYVFDHINSGILQKLERYCSENESRNVDAYVALTFFPNAEAANAKANSMAMVGIYTHSAANQSGSYITLNICVEDTCYFSTDCLDSVSEKIERLYIKNYKMNSDFNLFEKFPNAKIIGEVIVSNDIELETLCENVQIEELILNVNEDVNFGVLSSMRNLKKLVLHICCHIDLEKLSQAQQLEELQIICWNENQYKKNDFLSLSAMNCLKRLLITSSFITEQETEILKSTLKDTMIFCSSGNDQVYHNSL